MNNPDGRLLSRYHRSGDFASWLNGRLRRGFEPQRTHRTQSTTTDFTTTTQRHNDGFYHEDTKARRYLGESTRGVARGGPRSARRTTTITDFYHNDTTTRRHNDGFYHEATKSRSVYNDQRSSTSEQTRYAESFAIGITASVPQWTTTGDCYHDGAIPMGGSCPDTIGREISPPGSTGD